MGDAETGQAEATEKLVHNGEYRAYGGSLHRFMTDPGTKCTKEGYSLVGDGIGFPFVQAVCAEFGGTFLLTFATIGLIGTGVQDHFWLSIGVGVTYCFMVMTLGSVSGAHLNPLITMTTVAIGKTSVARGVAYVAVQIIGAVIAENLFLDATDNDNAPYLSVCGYTTANIKSNMDQGYLFIFFAILSYLYLFLLFRVAYNPRSSSIYGPLSTPVLLGTITFVVSYIQIGFASFGVFLQINPAICTASYDGYTRTNVDDLNNDEGAWASWLGAMFAAVLYAITDYAMKPQHTMDEKEEVARNENRLRTD